MIRDATSLAGLMRRRRWSPERRKAHRDRLLREMVAHAYDTTAYHRRRFDDAGVSPREIRGAEDLSRIPVSTKEDYREGPAEDRIMHGILPASARLATTSGSTGIPMKIYYDTREAARRNANFAMTRIDTGMKLTARTLNLRPGFRMTEVRPLEKLTPAWHLNRRCSVENAVEVARAYRPRYIHGLVAILELFALEAIEKEIRDIRPVMITCTGETLPPRVEALVEQAFGATVRSMFGSWEFGVFLAPCLGRGGYHLSADNLIVECLRDGREVEPGEEGRMVITNLTSRLMPYVRFNQGDIVERGAGPCGCGHPGLWLSRIIGREEDLVTTATGERYSSYDLIYPMVEMEEMHRYRVLQTAPDAFNIQYTAGEPLPQPCREKIETYFRDRIGASTVSTERVAELPIDRSGKLRKVIPYPEAADVAE